jgi:tetratricopeptide (TPR) repeat protein
MNVARAQALEVGATLHHHAGRPAEALAMLERADALREHVDEALSWISDGREVERWLIRGRCLRAVGQVEAAARAFVHGLEHASHRLRKQSREWMDWEHDDAALEIAQIHAEIGAIRDEAGVAEILARVPLSPRKTRATARMYAAYLAAIADDPDAAAFAFEQGQAEEGEAAHDRAFFRVAVAVTRSIALSYARAERVEEAIGWTHRIYQAYGFPASRMAERHRAKILARRAEGAQFEAVIDAAVHDALQRMERFVVGLFSGSLRDESEKGEDAGEDDDTDEEDDETDEDDEDP